MKPPVSRQPDEVQPANWPEATARAAGKTGRIERHSPLKFDQAASRHGTLSPVLTAVIRMPPKKGGGPDLHPALSDDEVYTPSPRRSEG